MENEVGILIYLRKGGKYHFLLKSGQSCDIRTGNQQMDVVGALIGIYGLDVLQVAHDVILAMDAIAAMHVACEACDI